ncbi:MAG: ORF6N domain-containing protein [candidate division WOR-3 bacterium]|nr:ORF6N domain-containing protein [candidate division WOR-3 bacterium]
MQQPIDRKQTLPATLRRIEQAILLIRGHRVMLSTDLAALYDVEPGALVQTVKRNIERFPDDFMFQLTQDEYRILKSQSVISSWGGRRHPPYAFTEQGVAMLSSVLRSKRAAQVNVEIMRTFVRLRRILAENAGLAQRLDELEKKYDVQFKVVFDAIRQLMQPPSPPRRKIGFASGPDDNLLAHDRPARQHRKP